MFSTASSAYEPGTHQNLSDTAARASILVQKTHYTDTNILDDLGLDNYQSLYAFMRGRTDITI